jgi:hypothetical protein
MVQNPVAKSLREHGPNLRKCRQQLVGMKRLPCRRRSRLLHRRLLRRRRRRPAIIGYAVWTPIAVLSIFIFTHAAAVSFRDARRPRLYVSG